MLSFIWIGICIGGVFGIGLGGIIGVLFGALSVTAFYRDKYAIISAARSYVRSWYARNSEEKLHYAYRPNIVYWQDNLEKHREELFLAIEKDGGHVG